MPNPTSPDPNRQVRQKILEYIGLNKPLEVSKLDSAYEKLLDWINSSGRNPFFLDIIIEFLLIQEFDISKAFIQLLEKNKVLTPNFINRLIARITDNYDADIDRRADEPAGNLKIFLLQKAMSDDKPSQEIIRENLSPFMRRILLLIVCDVLLGRFKFKPNPSEPQEESYNKKIRPQVVKHLIQVAIDYLIHTAKRGNDKYILLFPPRILELCQLHFTSIVNLYPIQSGEKIIKIEISEDVIKRVSYTQMGKFLGFLVNRFLGSILFNFNETIIELAKDKKNFQNYIFSLFREDEIAADLIKYLNNPDFIFRPVEIISRRFLNLYDNFLNSDDLLALLQQALKKIDFNKIFTSEFLKSFKKNIDPMLLENKDPKSVKKTHRSSLTDINSNTIDTTSFQEFPLTQEIENLITRYFETSLPSVTFKDEVETLVHTFENTKIMQLFKAFFENPDIEKIIDAFRNLEGILPQIYEEGVKVLVSVFSSKDVTLLDKLPTRDYELKEAIKHVIIKYNLFKYVDSIENFLLKIGKFVISVAQLFDKKFTYSEIINTFISKSPIPISALSNETFRELLTIDPNELIPIIYELVSGPMLNDLPKKFRTQLQTIFIIKNAITQNLLRSISVDNLNLLTIPYEKIEEIIENTKKNKHKKLKAALLTIFQKEKTNQLQINKILYKGLEFNCLIPSIRKILNDKKLKDTFLTLFDDAKFYNSYNKLITLILFEQFFSNLDKKDFEAIAREFEALASNILSKPSWNTAGYLLDHCKKLESKSLATNNNNVAITDTATITKSGKEEKDEEEELVLNIDDNGEDNKNNINNNNTPAMDPWKDLTNTLRKLYQYKIADAENNEKPFYVLFRRFGENLIKTFYRKNIFLKEDTAENKKSFPAKLGQNIIKSIIPTVDTTINSSLASEDHSETLQNNTFESVHYATALMLAIEIEDKDLAQKILNFSFFNNFDILSMKDCCENTGLEFAIREKKYDFALLFLQHCIKTGNPKPVMSLSTDSLARIKNKIVFSALLKNKIFDVIDFGSTSTNSVVASPNSSYANLNTKQFIIDFSIFDSDIEKELNTILEAGKRYEAVGSCIVKNKEKTENWFNLQVQALNSEYKYNPVHLVKMVAEIKKYHEEFYETKMKPIFLPWFEKRSTEILSEETEHKMQELIRFFREERSKQEDSEISGNETYVFGR